ncbi:MAG TPA: helix-turn-helix transcriptional regulator [Planctomycetaceae bacterium]|nr:helix-turn-helix transcriptional regulator [Planctomycetaceae bacterium]
MLGQILRETREQAGLTQEALAHAAGVDRSYISQLERDLKSPTVQMLFRLCHALGTRPSKLIIQLESKQS